MTLMDEIRRLRQLRNDMEKYAALKEQLIETVSRAKTLTGVGLPVSSMEMIAERFEYAHGALLEKTMAAVELEGYIRERLTLELKSRKVCQATCMRYLDGLTVTAIADKLEMSESQIRRYLRAAKEVLESPPF